MLDIDAKLLRCTPELISIFLLLLLTSDGRKSSLIIRDVIDNEAALNGSSRSTILSQVRP
jgi:hypothetical protein